MKLIIATLLFDTSHLVRQNNLNVTEQELKKKKSVGGFSAGPSSLCVSVHTRGQEP